MQIKAVAIWNGGGEIRRIDFLPNSLNIITGEAKAGKSALLEIVEFCLGRRTVSLPEGVLTRTVRWYGLVVNAGGQSVFIGRPGPTEGQATVSGAHLEIGGTDLEFPAFENLEVNTSADAVTDYLTRLCGIGEYENQPPSTSTRPPLRPTVRHASLFCFQRQNEIANPRQLFHRQDEDFMPQAIKDTLPYFLGAVNREAPTLRDRLSTLRREHRRAERELERVQQLETRAPIRAAALLSEAVDAGLIASVDPLPDDPDPLLREALEASSEPQVPEDVSAPEYRRLSEASRRVSDELRAIGDRAATLRQRQVDQGDYRFELGEQAARMETLGLLPDAETQDADGSSSDGADHCPVCGSEVEEPDPTVATLIEAAAETRAELDASVEAVAGRGEALRELEERGASLRDELRTIHARLSALAADRERVQAFRETAMARAYVKGRIAQYLDESSEVERVPQTQLRLNVEALARQIEELDERLDPENERQQVTSRLNVVADDMTEWADRLGLEHAAGRARIDPSRLTVVVDTQDGPIPLDRMGSASNWVGYHLISHFGLHRWFALHDRPVPRFLMLDQPTQAFYPPDVDPNSVVDVATGDLSDDDRRSVEAMFALMKDMVEELAPGLQLIVMDHASLPDSWFQDSILEVWRNGTKLVPAEWIEEG